MILPIVIGGFRVWIHRKYLSIAVPPYCFNPIKLTFTPYQIRYINDTPLKGRPGYKNMYFNDNNEVITVEEVAIDYYNHALSYKALHDEGRTMSRNSSSLS